RSGPWVGARDLLHLRQVVFPKLPITVVVRTWPRSPGESRPSFVSRPSRPRLTFGPDRKLPEGLLSKELTPLSRSTDPITTPRVDDGLIGVRAGDRETAESRKRRRI